MVLSVVLGALEFADSVVESKIDVDVPVCDGIESEELLEELYGAVVNVEFCCSAVSVELWVIDEAVFVIGTITLEEDATSIAVGADSSVCSGFVELAGEKFILESRDAVDVLVCVGMNAGELLNELLRAVVN